MAKAREPGRVGDQWRLREVVTPDVCCKDLDPYFD